MRTLARCATVLAALAGAPLLPEGPLGPVLEATRPRWLWPALRDGAAARHLDEGDTEDDADPSSPSLPEELRESLEDEEGTSLVEGWL